MAHDPPAARQRQQIGAAWLELPPHDDLARTRRLLGADMAWLSELDEARGVFQALAAEGGLTRSSVAMNIRSDRGVASVVMATRMPFTTPDYLHDTRFSHDPRFDDIFRAEGICALWACR